MTNAEAAAWSADIVDEGFAGLDGVDQPQWAHGLSAESPEVGVSAARSRRAG